MDVFWFFLGAALGATFGVGFGLNFAARRMEVRMTREVEYKRERLRTETPPAHTTQSVDAAQEVDRPHAVVRKGEIRPRAGRKRS